LSARLESINVPHAGIPRFARIDNSPCGAEIERRMKSAGASRDESAKVGLIHRVRSSGRAQTIYVAREPKR
jgi:hypothetical protein